MFRLLMVLLICLSPALGFAQTFPQRASNDINDLANVLNDDDRAEVREMLRGLKSDTGIEMTVLTIENQAPYAPNQTMEEFATAIFNHWEIGDASRNAGILVLVLPGDRAMRIELGSGYDKSWDDVAGRVIDRSFLPSFRSDKYARGIKDGISDTINTLARAFAKGQPAPKPTKEFPYGFFIFLTAAVVIFRRKIAQIFIKFRRCPNCRKRGGLWISHQVKTNPSPNFDGTDEKTTSCDFCDYRDRMEYPVRYSQTSSRRNRSGGSSFGGGSFGGGRSSGGGSSGRW